VLANQDASSPGKGKFFQASRFGRSRAVTELSKAGMPEAAYYTQLEAPPSCASHGFTVSAATWVEIRRTDTEIGADAANGSKAKRQGGSEPPKRIFQRRWVKRKNPGGKLPSRPVIE
jgi:hypothetical protein